MTWIRDIDRWFMGNVLPFRALHFGYALRLTGQAADAEDVIQEAYARLFALEDWRRVGNAHAFAMRTIHNIAVERFRRADVVRMDQALRLDAVDPIDDRPSPEREILGRAELKRVSKALDGLPARCRDVVRMRRIEGLSPKAIAEHLSISVSTVEKHLAKGLRLLTERLESPQRDQEAERIETWPSPTGRKTSI